MSGSEDLEAAFSLVKLWKLVTRNGGRDGGSCSMIISRKVLEYVTAEPFRRFRIRMASGQIFDIPHPEMILVGRTSVRIYTVKEGESHEKWHDTSLMLMETIEPLDAPVARAEDS